MPELPEVETIRRQLAKNCTGKRIIRVELLCARLLKQKIEYFTANVCSRKITHILRRGKSLILQLEKGYIFVHLRIAGWVIYPQKQTKACLCLILDDGSVINIMDSRTLAEVFFLKELNDSGFLRRLGPEPFKLNSRDFYAMLCRSSMNIKGFLMDQEKIAGIGNIYACEALFNAGISPFRSANSLTEQQARDLLRSLRAILKTAVRLGGSTIDNYRNINGTAGKMQSRHRVYQKAGLPCPVCSAIIAKAEQSNRTTYFCPQCQK
jgi:formamidopyrimidine-DNA glycosylase